MSELLTIPGTLRGYRAWSPRGVMGSRVDLHPLYARPGVSAWVDGENVATCNLLRITFERATAPVHTTPAPQWDCRCGFYARYEPTQSANGTDVLGVIEAYGRVILGERGFRAEKARILGLTHSWGWVTRHLQDTYPQAQFFPTLEEMLEAFPPPADVENMFGPEVAQEWPAAVESYNFWHGIFQPSAAIDLARVAMATPRDLLGKKLDFTDNDWEVVNG